MGQIPPRRENDYTVYASTDPSREFTNHDDLVDAVMEQIQRQRGPRPTVSVPASVELYYPREGFEEETAPQAAWAAEAGIHGPFMAQAAPVSQTITFGNHPTRHTGSMTWKFRRWGTDSPVRIEGLPVPVQGITTYHAPGEWHRSGARLIFPDSVTRSVSSEVLDNLQRAVREGTRLDKTMNPSSIAHLDEAIHQHLLERAIRSLVPGSYINR